MPAEDYNSKSAYRYTAYSDKINKARKIQTPPIFRSLDASFSEVEGQSKNTNVEYLESVSVGKIIDLISEGPIDGFCDKEGNTLDFFTADKTSNTSFLQSVYFDETQIYNPESEAFNYRIFDVDFRRGLNRQDPLPGDYEFAAQTSQKGIRLIPSNTLDISTKDNLTKEYHGTRIGRELIDDFGPHEIGSRGALYNFFKKQETHLFPVVHTVVNPLVEVVVVNLLVHVLSKLKVGKRSSEITPSEVSFLIYVGNEDGPFSADTPPLLQVSKPIVDNYQEGEFIYNDTGGYFIKVAKGLATSDYVFENIIHFPPNPKNSNRVIKVFRLEADMGYQAKDAQIECSLHSITEIIPHKLYYPNSAIVGTTIDATAFSNMPSRRYDMKLLRVSVPSNYIPDIKEYVGNWNGRFKNLNDLGGRRKINPDQEFEVIQRGKSAVTNKTADTKVKVVTGTKKYGSGSIFFDSSLGLSVQQDYAKRISITKDQKTVNLSNEDSPNLDLRVGDFGFSNFTIEFYIKVSESQVKTIYNTNGVQDTTGGRAGFYKTIMSSQEGSPPCTGANRSDNELIAIGDSSADGIVEGLEQHPYAYETVRGDGHFGSVFANELPSVELPISGNWCVEVGTHGDDGQILFRYFSGSGYWKIVNRGDNWGGNRNRSHRKVLISSDVDELVKIKSKTRIHDDEWHHVAIVRDGSDFKFYIDGEEDTDTLVRPDTDQHPEDLRGKSWGYYNGDVRGFVFRSGSQVSSGLINIGNDRAIRVSSASSGTTAKLHSSFNGYLDHIHVIRKCKYTKNFDTISWPGGGTGASPTRITDLIDNERDTVFLLNGDGEANNSTTIKDYNPSIVLASEIFDFKGDAEGSMLQWTDNPAWIFYDLITNKRYGLGKYGVGTDFVNKWNLYELGKYCDELVKTGFSPKYGGRDFDVVADDNETITAGEVKIRIKGFENQAQFIKEFPEGSKIAIYDLNNDEQSVHRRVKYLRAPADRQKKYAEEGKNKLLSYIPNDGTDSTSPGDAVITLQRIISQEECYLLDPSLRMVLLMKKTNQNLDSPVRKKTMRDMILDHIEEKDENHVLNVNFDNGKKINTTSLSGTVSAEFPKELDVLEPRFTCNLYLTHAVDAFKVLNDLASAFRGLTYIVGGRIFASFDKKRDPLMNFTNSNVKNGVFRYVGSPKTSRFTSVVVRYVDKYENFRPKVEYVEDAQGIIKYGLIERELIAFGCTSRGQARRLGQWFLFSSQLETEALEFTAGKEASYLKPGDVVKVIDKHKTRKRYGGRIININGTGGKITLDAEVADDVVGQTITIAIPQKFETQESLDQKTSETRGITDEEIAAQRKPQLQEFEVSAVEKNDSVPKEQTILTLTGIGDSELSGVGKIKPGAIWILQNNTAGLKIQEVLYRVMSVEENSPVEYRVSCLEYNESKFDATEKDIKLDKVRYVGVSNPTSTPSTVEDVRLSVVDSGDGTKKTGNVTFTRLGPDLEGDIVEVAVTVRAASQYTENANVVTSGGTVTKIFHANSTGANGEKVQNISIPLEDLEGEIENVEVQVKNSNQFSDDEKGKGMIEWCGDKPC